MADVTLNADGQQEKEDSGPQVSDFQRYMEENPQTSEEIMKILVTLFNQPLKQSQVQPFLREMLGIPDVEADRAQELREENAQLQTEIFDLQDQLIAMEKEYEEIKEEEL